MKKNNVNIPWIVGGNIPAEDRLALEKSGAAKAFATGTTIEAVLSYINSL